MPEALMPFMHMCGQRGLMVTWQLSQRAYEKAALGRELGFWAAMLACLSLAG